MIHHHQSFSAPAHVFKTLPVVYAVTLLLLSAYVKGSYYLQVPPSAAHLCLYSDGTKVTEEFFQTLPDNTELVLLSREQHWSGGGDPTYYLHVTNQTQKNANVFTSPASALPSVLEDISRLLCADIHSDAIIEAAKGLLSDEQTSKRRKILSDLLQNLEDRSELETREEDKDWFKGRMYDVCT